ncbi:MAG: cytidylyltransferase domain-containing protein [bacterium]
MKIVSIIQARMDSGRLPGKVMLPVSGKPIIYHVIQAISGASLVDEIVVATTINPIDNELASYIRKMGINVYRGNENDVLLRYAEAAKAASADIVVRNTGDNPLVDFGVINEVIGTFLKGDFDYVSNNIERSWPRGLDTEVLSIKALEKANREGSRPEDREHVTIYHRTNQELFRVFNVKALPQETWPDLRLTVDTIEDYNLVRTVFKNLYRPGCMIRINEVIGFLKSHPEIVQLNNNIEQKKVFSSEY